MPPVVPDPKTIRAFRTQKEFEQWLAKNHSTAAEVWIKMHKKGTGLASINWTEAVEAALCWGWIDGIRKSFDDTSFLQRLTPRRPKSIWSHINTQHVERLIAEGRMQPSGQVHVDAAKADGRWDRAYAPQRSIEVPPDLEAAIRKNKKALVTFGTLNKSNLFALAFRAGSAKRPETRQLRIREFVALLARGETLLPNGRPKKA